MKFCEHCGVLLDGDALFCTNCGTRLSLIQPAPQVVDTVSHTHAAPAPQQDNKEKEKKSNRIILFILLGVVLAAGALIAVLTLGNSKVKPDCDIDETEKTVQEKYRLHGAVDKYPIYMKLTIEGNVATGSYYYESQGPDKVLNLKGIYDNSKLELFETNENGQQTGHFSGQLKRGIFIGDFYDARGNSMHFRLDE